MRFFDPATQQIEQNAQTTTPTDVWIPYNSRITSAVGDPNSVAAVNDTISSNSINFAEYLAYVLGRNTLTANIKTSGGIVTTGNEILLGSKLSANMNVTTDQAIPITRIGSKNFRITRIYVTNASVSLTTAAGGVYPTTSKGGTAIVAAGQAYSALTSAAVGLDLTIAAVRTLAVSNIYLSLTTAQGTAATADIYVFGYILP